MQIAAHTGLENISMQIATLPGTNLHRYHCVCTVATAGPSPRSMGSPPLTNWDLTATLATTARIMNEFILYRCPIAYLFDRNPCFIYVRRNPAAHRNDPESEEVTASSAGGARKSPINSAHVQ